MMRVRICTSHIMPDTCFATRPYLMRPPKSLGVRLLHDASTYSATAHNGSVPANQSLSRRSRAPELLSSRKRTTPIFLSFRMVPHRTALIRMITTTTA